MSLSVRRKVLLVVFLPLPLMLAACALLAWQAHRLSTLNGWAQQTSVVIAQVHFIQRLLVDQESGARGYYLTGERIFLEPFERGRAALKTELAELRKLTADDSVRQGQIATLEGKYADWLAAVQLDRNLGLAAARDPEFVVGARVRKTHMDSMRSIIDAFMREEEGLLTLRQRRVDRGSRILVIGGSILFALVGGFLVWFVRRVIGEVDSSYSRAITDLEQANLALAENAAIVQHSTDAITGKAFDGTITSWNPAAEALYGYSAREMIGRNVSVLATHDRATEMEDVLERISDGQTVEPFETVRVRKDGKQINVHVTVSPIRHKDEIRGASVIARDITEHKRSEQQLREMQKLESLGLVAGGVAHDFNNLLVGIMGNSSLVLESIPPSSPNYEPLSNVVQASEKAAHLTQQMLAYAGKGRFVTQKIDLSKLVTEISALVQTSIPKSVQLRLELGRGLPCVEADAGQMQQLIMNLVINGAEAVGEANGTVYVTTDTQEVDDAYVKQNFVGQQLQAGIYVSLEVQDTGCGMDEETRRRIFDPFFTTKFTGRGLGLAAALGIIRGHNGIIRVYSAPGKGSTFKILLPAVAGVAQEASGIELLHELKGGGIILVVDDEEVVRKTAKTALERYGYSILLAENGHAAVDIFREHDAIALVLLDMMMPVMSGEEAFRQMLIMRPTARVIVSSGYNEVEAIRRFTTKGVAGFIQKPYTASKLARTIKRVLEGAMAFGVEA